MRKKLGFIMILLFALGSCGNTPDHKGKTPLVEAGGQFLYVEDLRQVMPVNLSEDDSVAFAERYIKEWVEDILFISKASRNIPNNANIGQMVEDYRLSLIRHAYQEELIRQKLVDKISADEIKDYYDANKNLFRVEVPLIKGIFIKVPVHAKGVNNVRRWYRQKSQEAIENLEKYSISNAVVYDYFYDQWREVSDEIGKIPLPALKGDLNYLNGNRNVEVQDTAFIYFLHVEDFLGKDEIEPLDFASDDIKEILINMKRVEFINKVKEELFNEASDKEEIKYY